MPDPKGKANSERKIGEGSLLKTVENFLKDRQVIYENGHEMSHTVGCRRAQ